MSVKRIAILGAGGFAREVRWLISEISAASAGERYEFAGYLISDLETAGETANESELKGDLSWLASDAAQVDCLALGIGDPSVRLELGDLLSARHPTIAWPTLIHPSVIYDRTSCRFEPGVLLCAGTIATVHVTVDRFAMINLACTLGHEARIGAGSVLNPTVNVSGGVALGERVLVGTGAEILQYVEVGDGARIGAGAVVTDAVDKDTTVVGVPARPRGS